MASVGDWDDIMRGASAMHVDTFCVPYQIDVAHRGCALGPQAFLDHGLLQQLEAKGHIVSHPVWIELPKSERTRDSVTNLGHIAKRTSAAVSAALQQNTDLVLVLEGDCTHAVGALGGLAQVQGSPGVAWFDAHGDLNTMEATTSAFWGGVPYAVALGWDLGDWRVLARLGHTLPPAAAWFNGDRHLGPSALDAVPPNPVIRIVSGEMVRP